MHARRPRRTASALCATFLGFAACASTEEGAASRPPVMYLERTAEEWIADFRAPEQETREAAVDALAALGPAMIPRVVPELGDHDGAVRYSAVQTLGRYEADAWPAAEEIAARVADPEPRVRAEAAHVLMKIGPAATAVGAGPLTAALTDPEWYVRYRAVTALETFDGRAYPEAYDALRRIEHKDLNWRVRKAATSAAERIWDAYWLTKKPADTK